VARGDAVFPNGLQHYVVGGLLVGLAVSIIFVATGLIAGMSTVLTASWSWVSKSQFVQQARFVDSRGWRLVLAAGLVAGSAVWLLTVGGGVRLSTDVATAHLVLGGFIAGFGARMSNGCTSGHGICGLASLQKPSLLAVVIFVGMAIVTTNVMVLLGGAH
jgi:uncharacterized protein